MSIILVSRQIGSLGTDLAGSLSKELKYYLLNKEKLETELFNGGLKEVNINQYDEINPGFWKSLSSEKDRYFNYLKYVILKTAKKDNCIIIGRGAQILLKDVPGIIKLRFVAPKKTRIERICKKLKCDEKNAEKIIQKDDAEKAGYHKTFFSVDWEDSSNYDMVINTETLNEDNIQKIIRNLIELVEFNKKSKSLIADRLLSQKVVDKVLYEDNIPINLFEVESKNGNVRLYGSVSVPSDIELCEKSVSTIEDVKSVDNQIAFISDYPTYYSPY